MADFRLIPIGHPTGLSGNVFYSLFTLDEATDAHEVVFQAQGAHVITRLMIRQGSVTGTAPTYRVSLQGVGTDGNPDGTIKGATNSCYADVTPVAGGNNTAQWLTLGETYTASRGEMLCVVIAHQSGTIDASNKCTFASIANGMGASRQFPYFIGNAAGVRTRVVGLVVYAYGTASATYGNPSETLTNYLLTNASNPREAGLIFNIPATWCFTYKIIGLYLQNAIPAASSFTLRVYDTDGTTVLQDIVIDSDMKASATNGNDIYLFNEATLATLNAGSTYRATAEHTGAATNWQLQYIDCDSAEDAAAWDGGANFYATDKPSGGAWTDRTARRPLMGLVISDWTLPAGGGLGADMIFMTGGRGGR